MFVTMLLPSHLLIDKHWARTVEWKAELPDASSHGHCSMLLLGMVFLPPRGLNLVREVCAQVRFLALGDFSVSEERNQKIWRILVVLCC